MIHDTVLTLVGATPLVRIHRLNPHPGVLIAGKLEAMNPGGSIKDRVALAMIEAAERSGELTPEKTVIEATSGNTGIGLAMVCAVKGYRLKLLMPDSASEERKRIMRAYGAEIVLTPGHLSTDGAIEESYRLAREEPDKYVLMDQFNNPASIQAHYLGTAREIWEQTGGRITHMVACLGTSGTAMGLIKGLKEFAPDVVVVAVEPYEGHKIQGLKNMKESYPPGIFNKSLLDRIIHVEDETAFEMSRRAAQEEGLFVGMSSGAALAGAVHIASELEEGLIVAILPDGGERYLSTPLFAPKPARGPAIFDFKSRKTVGLAADNSPQGIFTFGPGPDTLDDPEFWRRVVILDVLAAYLSRYGARPEVAVGLADLEDHTLALAQAEGKSLDDYSQTYLDRVNTLARKLGIGVGVSFVLASRCMETMLSLCRTLLGQGVAYEKLRSVYYDVQRDSRYGSLSLTDLDKLSLGKTVDLDSYAKGNPRDFTLLKRTSLQDLKLGHFFKTEWGNVRPTWHLQMAAAALDELGEVKAVFGSRTQWFPHLENIRGIWDKGAGKTPNVWSLVGSVENAGGCDAMHLEQSTDPSRVIRFWLLSAFYRKPLTCSEANLTMWRKNWKKVQDLAVSLTLYEGGPGRAGAAVEQAVFDLKKGFTAAMEDDLALHRFWPVLFSFCRSVNTLVSKCAMIREEAETCLDQLKSIDEVLRIIDWTRMPVPNHQWPQSLETLVKEREAARRNKDFATADKLRDRISREGYLLEDTVQGPRVFALPQ
ncbi:MAG: cysteine synthase [Desulfovibrionales bacterium]